MKLFQPPLRLYWIQFIREKYTSVRENSFFGTYIAPYSEYNIIVSKGSLSKSSTLGMVKLRLCVT